MKAKVFVACATVGGNKSFSAYTHNSFAHNLWELGIHRIGIEGPKGYDEYPLSHARNTMMEDFKKSNCTNIFIYDDDSVFMEGTIMKLLRSNKPIVSGYYLSRRGTGSIVAFRRMKKIDLCNPDAFGHYKPYSFRELATLPRTPSPGGPLVQVDAVGMGCILMTKEAVEQIDTEKSPLFLEWSPIMKPDVHRFGEDLWFGDKCMESGVPIYVNLDCFVGHHAFQVIGYQHLKLKAAQEGIQI